MWDKRNCFKDKLRQTACPDCHEVMCSMPPIYLGAASVSGRTVTKYPSGNPLTCDCRATELKQVLFILCIQCIIQKKWVMHLTELLIDLRSITKHRMQS